jgi:TonB family protein
MKRYLPLVFLLMMHPSTLLASEKAKEEGKDLVEQAEAKTNIFALPSFQMKASVRIDNKGEPLNGSYLLLWNGPGQWREELSFPGYSEIQVGGKGVVFIKRTAEVLPLRIDQLRSTLGYGSGSTHPLSLIHLAPGPGETVKKVRERKVDGSQAACVEISDHDNHAREVCVDRTTGGIVRQGNFADKGTIAVGGKLFPASLSYTESGKRLVEIQITELKTTELLPPSAFEPPNGAVSKPGCMNPSPGHLVKRVTPQYPEPERRSHVDGSVAIFTLIAADGVPGHLQVVSGLTPGLNKVSLDAVQQWRYEPATCNGVPVSVETVVTVNYALHP